MDFPYLVSSSNYNAVMLPASFKGDFDKDPVGTGPFLLETYDERQGATFTKNPSYWQKDKGLPYLDGVEMTFNPDMQAQVVYFQAGEADMMLQSPTQGTQSLSSDPSVKIGDRSVHAHQRLPHARGQGAVHEEGGAPGHRLLPQQA